MTSSVPAKGDGAQQVSASEVQPRTEAPNPYFIEPHNEPSAASLGVQEIPVDECWRLLESVDLGRLAIVAGDGRPDVFPMNFLVYDGSVIIRTAPGGKLQALHSNPAVAFEVDGSDVWRHWSVVMRGDVVRMDADELIEASGALELFSWSPTAKHNFLRLTPDSVSGRRFRKRLPTAAAEGEPGATGEGQDEEGRVHDEKPSPIPHYAPLE
ncbi:pyridoxamine 5'-phosphate oxidase family protein [Microbacterium sp. NPDC076911]|uniref:pyridoxamine 5'-phosphate oxidase family protein n=1 Tax=Microbacterium sp. NPDC076911 TaxID=3154958 RepID=UPI0034488054